jgi:glycyl-tRNA synthetase beta chain
MPDFLLEIGIEEIPDWMIDAALADLRARFEKLVADQVLRGTVHCTNATPRRLILHAQRLTVRQADSEELITGPPKSAGAGAAQGFARKNATTVDALETVTTEKGEYFSFRKRVKGRETRQILAEALPVIIPAIYFPKTMYWTGKGGVRFIRPIRWIVALLDHDVVPFEVAGVQSGNTTRGHRVLGGKRPHPLTIANYQLVLAENGVIIRAADRRARIEKALGADVQPDPELLQALVYLTEFPTVIRGSFDPSYLELPKEILSTVMRHHQRYFSVLKPDGSLAPEFVAVTNTDGDPDGLIRQGNERVLRARFNDARFFWGVDQQKKLSERVDDLAKVTFQAKLGSYYDKTERVRELASRLARQVGADEDVVSRAATLSKCDLTTQMVKEFTELQGVVGGLYAVAQGEGDGVGSSIYDQYKPTSMEDSIPRTLEGQVLSIADKFDTLRECFRIGMIPTGSKDPFALRRAAQGIVKILFEAKLPLSVLELTGDLPELQGFLRERIQFYLREVRGYAYDEVNAVMAVPVTMLADLADRVEAIHQVRPTPDFEPLAASFKRIKNILKQANVENTGPVNPELLNGGPERDLYEAFKAASTEIEGKTYAETLARISQLRPRVDLFFDKILVNDPEETIRMNRLALLRGLLTEFSSIADFSEIVTASA